jgi:hypothetical protein
MTFAFKSRLLLLKIFNINVWEVTRNRSSNPACCYLAIQHKAGFGVNFSGFTRNRIAFTKKTPVDRAHGPMDHYEMAVHSGPTATGTQRLAGAGVSRHCRAQLLTTTTQKRRGGITGSYQWLG